MEDRSAEGDRRQTELFGAPAPENPAPTHSEHPQANRELWLGGCRIRYELRRARRRSIGLTVGAEGLRVAAPHRVAQAEIDAVLQAKAAWILRKLAEQAQRRQQLQQSRIEWREGALLPYLGVPLALRFDTARRGIALDAEEPGVLRLGLPPDTDAQQIGDAVRLWLQRQARGLFKTRIADFAPRLQVQCTRLSLSSARTRWGSASASGTIRLNWRLVHLSPALIDYVVVHELAHLREMNHGPRFWAHVQSVLPDWEQARARLRRELVPELP